MGISRKLTVTEKNSALVAAQIEELKTLLSLPLMTDADEDHLRRAAETKGIPFKEIKKAQAWLQTAYPEMFERIQGPSEGALHLCLDENCPYQMATDLHRYGHVTSVDLQGWSGKLDPVILGYARANKIDAIIGRDRAQKSSRVGRDRDLTNAALDMWDSYFRGQSSYAPGKSALPKIPVLMHLTSKYPYRDGTLDTFQRQYEQIHELIKNPTHAIVRVSPTGVTVAHEASLERLFRLSRKPKAERDQWPLPREFGKVTYVANGLCQTRHVNVDRLMQVMREETSDAFKRISRRRKPVESDEIYAMIENVVDRVKENPEFAGKVDELMVLEMAVRAARNTLLPERLVVKFKSSGMTHCSDLAKIGMARLSAVEKPSAQAAPEIAAE